MFVLQQPVGELDVKQVQRECLHIATYKAKDNGKPVLSAMKAN